MSKKLYYNMANSNTDKQLERMKYLMEFKNTIPNQKVKTNIEYHTTGSDGKEYGIIRENNMYYIKTSTPDKALVSESYEYINGFNYRNENGYKSYNEATKHLELKLMALNESRNVQAPVATTNTNKSQEVFKTLTEEARRELDRMHQIFENSNKIGKNNVGNPEGKGSASAEQTEKNNAPFSKKAEASLDKDPKFNGTVDGATPDNKKVGDVNSDLQSDKMKSANSGSEKDMKDAHDDLEGEGVADKKPSGGKAVMVNESFDGIDSEFEDEPLNGDDDLAGFNEPEGNEFTPEDIIPSEAEPGEVKDDDYWADYDAAQQDADMEDEFDGEDDLDTLLREFMDTSVETGDITGQNVGGDASNSMSLSEGEEVLDGPHGSGNSVAGEETMDRIEECGDGCKVQGAGEKESKIVGPDKVMDGPHGSLDVQTWNKLQESIDRITNAVCEKLAPKKPASKKKETIQEAINRIVAEEVTKLDAWGKHPRYQKPAFQTPANKEVAPNNSKDWNDDSTKGEAPYGKQIGSSAPFDKQVDVLTDAVLKAIKESYGVKKK